MGKLNNLKKILINMIVIGIMMILSTNAVFAEGKNYEDGSSLLSQMEKDTSSFLEKGQEGLDGINPGEMAKNFKGLGQILTMVGVGVLVAVTTYMGIKYLTAGPEAQAKLKVQLVGIVVSGCVIFGAYWIWKIVVTMASNLQG